MKEEPDDRLEGESKAARDKRVFEEQMREARAERKEGAAAADAAMLKKNADIDMQKKQLAKKRMSFLMKQADVFGKFIGADVMRKCVPRAAPCVPFVDKSCLIYPLNPYLRRRGVRSG
eukprot:COSAG02_NODE_26461_length_632_cov_1.249531_2_plen_118_part_00